MFGGVCRKFLDDELGGGTIMGLLWFMLLVGITGMAVDTTNGFRNRTMLQATADAAVLAAVIDLPNEATAVATAVFYSVSNMPGTMYGEVLKAADVEVGAWDMAARSHTEGGVVPDPLDPAGGLFPDTVRVTLRQTEANANAVPVNFLRIIGLMTWDVNVEAVAQRYLPDCLTDGLVARGVVDISSNNSFINEICIHGQQGVMLQEHNYEELGVIVSMPDMDTQLVIPANGMESNPGLADALREQSLVPRMVNHVDEIMLDMLTMESYVMPNYINTGSADGSNSSPGVVDAPLYWVSEGKVKGQETGIWTYDFDNLETGKIYHITCPEGEILKGGEIERITATVPPGTVLNQVAIISDCPIHFGSNVVLSDVILASLDAGNDGGGGGPSGSNSGAGGPGVENANITFASGATLGTADNCATGGGVQIFTNASVQFASTTSYNGVQIVAAGDVDLGARDMGINGINVQAGRDITLTSNNAFGLCSGGAPNLQTVAYYRLVH
jgi:hypothetical protein